MLYHCQQCDSQYSKWQGQCDECSKWGTIREASSSEHDQSAVVTSIDTAHSAPRFSTGMHEFDNVLGGGLVPGSLLLLAGDPGIGKSTLILQAIHAFARKNTGTVLYICGEESPEQISLRMVRLSVPGDRIQFISDTRLGAIIGAIKKHAPSLVVVDSIQTTIDAAIASEAGSVTQLRASTAQFLACAKQTSIPIVLIGHVTKEGTVAGPQLLSHMVDVVLYLEGDRLHEYRLLRSSKNRFGPTNQVGVFSMTEQGLVEVKNPSQLFLEEGGGGHPGSVVSVIMEGSRPFLIEIQSLTNKTSYGYPKRAASGFDLSRLELLLAVLQRRAGLKLENQDVFLNVVGGLRVKDPALDLAACLAIASSLSNQPMPHKSIALGEVGLSGEVRPAAHLETRVSEAKRLGFTSFFVPKHSAKDSFSGMHQISNITQALSSLGISK
ncbi:DNA repair protein RadA [bacterium CG10_46_32]|nr:MAG: DNA repair protein RadA [bacterium CG10_46_32]PIR55847.1 MAG: DNA repair protein RadA [Parcubacteria group bacterium CG10_big_fil_rev_8_21_14_0_10_46_32]